MNFSFTQEQELLRNSVAKFMEKECPKEYVRIMDKEQKYPLEICKKMAELGWLGITIPEQFGGSGGDIIDQVLMIEELARGSTAVAVVYLLNICFAAKSFLYLGNEEQKMKYLPQITSGNLKFSLGLTEPSGGSDALSLSTRAVRDGSHYIINGQKMFITGAHVADYIILVARSGPKEKKLSKNITLFIMDSHTKGVDIRLLDKLGNKAAGTTEIFLEDVVIPSENILGEEHNGWYQLFSVLNNERISLAAICLGTTQAIINESMKYVLQRQAFGKVIGQFQYIQKYITDMVMGLESARLLTYKAAWLQSQGKECSREAAIAKIIASEVCFDAATKGMRIFGGYGYMMEYDIQRFWRDSELFLIAPITNEMGRNYLAQELGLPRSF